MEIVNLSIEKLKPYEKNPRNNKQAIDKVAKSIEDFGFQNPIILDKDYIIICGHTRFEAAKKLKYKNVPCIIAKDLTPSQVKAFRLVDNRTNEFAEWNEDLLHEELADLLDEDFDLNDYEFDLSFLDDDDKEVLEDEFDYILPNEPKSKIGQIYKLGNHRLMCGDSTKEEDVAKLMNGEKANMVFTDPPYNVDYEGGTGMKIQNDKQSDSDFKEFLNKAFINMSNNVKAGGSIYCCHADTEGINFRTAFINAGFKLAECLIWVKNSLVLGRQDYHWRHEPILYGWKEGAAHYFIDDRTQDTVWEYNKPKVNDLHPTMKPIDLICKAIKNSSKKNNIILDLFGGSGSTLIACEQLDRSCYMMELDPKYVDVIIERWETYTGKKAELISE